MGKRKWESLRDRWSYHRHWRLPILLGLVALLLGLALAIIADWKSPGSGDIFSRFSDAGISLIVAAAVGLLVTLSLKVAEEARIRSQERQRVFLEIVLAYNEVKRGRRELRASGLVPFKGGHVVSLSTTGQLTSDQAREIRTCMANLNAAQLRFASVGREIQASGLFVPDVLAKVRRVEKYLHGTVVKNWERHGHRVWGGARNLDDAMGMDGFLEFKGAEFRKNVQTPLREVSDELHRTLYGARVASKLAPRA